MPHWIFVDGILEISALLYTYKSFAITKLLEMWHDMLIWSGHRQFWGSILGPTQIWKAHEVSVKSERMKCRNSQNVTCWPTNIHNHSWKNFAFCTLSGPSCIQIRKEQEYYKNIQTKQNVILIHVLCILCYLYNNQQMHNYLTNDHTATCFDTIM
jgi:hypothetical protein